jgi:NADPH-dependent curcumin reductase CurA
MAVNRQIILDAIPAGKLGPEHFRGAEGAMPSPGEGELLLRTRFVSIDAAARAWMQGPTYRPAVLAGDVMAGYGLAEVVESRSPEFAPGDLVYAESGWQEYNVQPASLAQKAGSADPLSHLISVYGVAGLTAYFGLLDCAEPKAGETVVVSAAAGAVGSIVGQIARIKGCRTVGLAGGQAKCDVLTGELGYDAAVDYKAFGEDMRALHGALREACGGKGADIYFDNVGGGIFDVNMFNMNNHGRVVCCGSLAAYDGPRTGAMTVPGLVVVKRLTLRGFIVTDFYGRRAEAVAELKAWVESGRLKVREDVIDGLENLPEALIGLLAGGNIGKRMVRVS